MTLADVALPAFDLGNVLTGSGFGALVWYLVARQGPRQQMEFAKELAETRADFVRQLAEERKARAKITDLLLVMLGAAMTSPAIRDNPQVVKAMEKFATGDGAKEAS